MIQFCTLSNANSLNRFKNENANTSMLIIRNLFIQIVIINLFEQSLLWWTCINDCSSTVKWLILNQNLTQILNKTLKYNQFSSIFHWCKVTHRLTKNILRFAFWNQRVCVFYSISFQMRIDQLITFDHQNEFIIMSHFFSLFFFVFFHSVLKNVFRNIVRRVYKNDALKNFTVKKIRKTIEKMLNLNENYFKNDFVWKKINKNIIQSKIVRIFVT